MMSNSKNILANEIREARKRLGINQLELCKKCGVTQATLSRIESGEIKYPRINTVGRIARELGMSAHYLIAKSIEEKYPADRGFERLVEVWQKLNYKGRDTLLMFAEFYEGWMLNV